MASTRTRAKSASRRLAGGAILVALAGFAAGCGSGDSAPGVETTGGATVAATVEKLLYDKGDTQGVSCGGVGAVAVSGVARDVVRCSFSEEANGAGTMRARAGCFALVDGQPLDVTMDVPAGVTCFTKT